MKPVSEIKIKAIRVEKDRKKYQPNTLKETKSPLVIELHT